MTKATAPLDTLSEQQWMRDLSWTAASPLMVRLPGYDSDPLPPPAAPAAPFPKLSSRFLGPYFENLWHLLLESSPHLALIAHGLQIHHEGRTLGEFDFLVRDSASQAVLHQEIAVKFYCGIPLPSEQAERCGAPSLWFGPNLIDRLDLKINKLLREQIHLSEMPQAAQRLRELGVNRLTKQIVVKGYLFHPIGNALPLPDYVNANCLQRQWLIFRQLPDYLGENTAWRRLRKLRWLSPAVAKSTELLAPQQLIQAIRQPIAEGRAEMIAGMQLQNDGTYKETNRFLVLPDQWPEAAVRALANKPVRQITPDLYR